MFPASALLAGEYGVTALRRCPTPFERVSRRISRQCYTTAFRAAAPLLRRVESEGEGRRGTRPRRIDLSNPAPSAPIMSESYIVVGGKASLSDAEQFPANAPPSPGEGFLGSTLVKALVARYPSAAVSSLDIVQRHFPEKSQWTFYSADLTSLPSLSAAFKASGATTVFHTASPWTGSGADVCEKVNVQGTQTIVDACVQEGVRKLVFTSSAGTVYNGEDLINVDERMPFPEKALDAYNVTKVGRIGLVRMGADLGSDGRPRRRPSCSLRTAKGTSSRSLCVLLESLGEWNAAHLLRTG